MNGNDATAAMVAALETANVPYMLVGSFSSNVYGVVRATKDADFVVQCASRDITAVVRQLGPPFSLDPQLSFESVTATVRYIVNIAGDAFRIELFQLSDDPHDQRRFQRRRKVALKPLGCEAFVATPEDVIVTKLRWASHAQRGKDRDDVRDVIAVQEGSIDWSYVHAWAEQHGTRTLLDEIRASIPPENPAERD